MYGYTLQSFLPVVFTIITRNFGCVYMVIWTSLPREIIGSTRSVIFRNQDKRRTRLTIQVTLLIYFVDRNTWDHHAANCQQPLSPWYKLCNRFYLFCHSVKTIWPLVQLRTFVINTHFPNLFSQHKNCLI